MSRTRGFLLALVLVVSCAPPDTLPWKEADRLEVTELAHVSSRYMFVVLRNPGPYRLTKFRFELSRRSESHRGILCHIVDVVAEVPPRATVRIRLPLAGDSFRCDRDSTRGYSILDELSDMSRDRVHRTQVCALTDDPSWDWSLIRVEGRRESPH